MEVTASILLTDTGFVHGTERENGWLKPGTDYMLETPSRPLGALRFTLKHRADVSGGRAWACEPTIPRLLELLNRTTQRDLSKRRTVTLRVRVIFPR